MLDLILRAAALALMLLWLAPAAVFVTQVSAALLPARKRKPAADPRPGGVVLVPAHNEGAPLADTVAALLSQLSADDRLVVIADNCGDDTAAAAARGATPPGGPLDPRVTVLERTDPDLRGKGYALDFALDRLAAERATGTATGAAADAGSPLFVLDADCRVSPGGVDRLMSVCARTGRPTQARTLCTVDPRTDPDAAGPMAVSELGLLFKNRVRPRGSARLGLPCQLMGTGMALPGDLVEARRAAGKRRGGGAFGGDLAEDMQLGVAAALAGRSPLFLEEVEVNSPLPTSLAGFDGQRTRWEQGHLETLTGGVPKLVKYAVLKDDLRALGLAADLAVPPFSLLVVGWFAVAAGLGLLGWWAGFAGPLIVHLVGGVLLAAAVLVGWWAFGRDRVPAAALASVPRFVLRKLPIYARWFSTGAQTEWVRTERAAEAAARKAVR